MSVAVARDEPPLGAAEHHPRATSYRAGSTVSEPGPAQRRGVSGPRLVLIADDHRGTRQSLADIMKAEGYLVVEAEDGRAALGVLAASSVDVLLLDLAMPHVDGIEVLRQIDSPPPVVIVYSAFDYYEPDEVQGQVGFKVFRSLRKPVAPPRLVSVVADAIGELDRFD